MRKEIARAMYEGHRARVLAIFVGGLPPFLPAFEMLGEEIQAHWLAFANDALAAMREPTMSMKLAGYGEIGYLDESADVSDARDCWQAMIDAASRIEARSDETPQAVQPEGREPDPEGVTPK